MERNRDLRIATTAGNGFRQQRITSLKESAEDREMELHETVSFKGRERLQKKDRDRELPKRRRVERYAVQHKNHGEGYREDESTDASDEEYRDNEEDARIHFLNKLNQPSLQSSSISNNRRSLRTHRSSPVLRASVDETIGVPIPRRARSTSIKRLHDHCNSSCGKSGEDLNQRRYSSSPATSNQIWGDDSPSFSGASKRKKMKSVEPRARALKSTSNLRPSSEIQDDIEIEVVEALFDLMKQSHSLSSSSKNQEIFVRDSVNAADEGLTKGVKDENKTFLLRYGKSIKVDPETTVDDSMEEVKKDEGIKKEKFPNDSALLRGDGFLNKLNVLSPKESESPSCVKVDAYEVQDPKVTRADDIAFMVETNKEAKLEIDLMVSPPLTSSPEKDVLADMAPLPKYMAHDVQKTIPLTPIQKSETISKDGPSRASNQLPKLDLEKHYHDILSVRDGGKQQHRGQKEQKNQLQTSLSPFQISLCGWPGVLPHPGYQQAVLPMDDRSRFRIAMQPPKFQLLQPLPKRSATHQYIARSIQQHQQLVTKSLWSGRTGVATLCGAMPLNPNSLPTTQRLISGSLPIGERQGWQNLGAITCGSGKDKRSEVPSSLSWTKSKELMLQQASLHTPANNILHDPAFSFPLGHHQKTVIAPAKSSGPAQSVSANGNMPLRSNSAVAPSVNLSLPGEEAVTSFSSPNFPSNEVTPYMAVLQNNGSQFPISTNVAMPQLEGVQSPSLPLFNSSLYSSAMFSVSQSQKLSSRKFVDNNIHSLIVGHSTQTEKRQFPLSHTSNKSDSDTQEQSTEDKVELIQQPLSASFGLITPACPALDFSSAIFPMLPDMAWNGYQMVKQKNFQTSEGKSAIGSSKIDDGSVGISGKPETRGRKSSSADVSPVSMIGTSIVDGLAGIANFVPYTASGNQQPFTPSSVAPTSVVLPNHHQHQQHSVQLPKHYMQQMQRTGTPNVLPGSFLPGSFPIQNPFSSKVSVPTDNSSYSHNWQNLPRSTALELSSQSAKQVSAGPLQGQQIVSNKQPVLTVGSTDSSIYKIVEGK